MSRAFGSNAASQRRTTTKTRRRARESEERPRILVVDDDPFVLKAVRKLLAAEWSVDTAVGATTAAGMMNDRSYDAVITDYNMPGRDGLWLLEMSKRKFPSTRRILLSSDTPVSFTRQIASGLVQRYVAKGVEWDHLSNALDKLI